MKNRMRNLVSALLISILLLASVTSGQTPAGKGQASQPTPQAASTTVTGSGTPSRLSKWLGVSGTSSFVLGDSSIFEDKFGNVGIGTDAPTAKLTVAGMIQTTLGGYKFPDGTVQTTAATSGLQSITHDATLMGNGTAASPLKIAVPLNLSGTLSVINTDTPNTMGAIVVNGFDADSGNGGDGVVIHGGKTSDNNNKKGGRGVTAYGGDGRTSGTGGVGVYGTGGNGPTPGAGVSAHGGDTFTAGGFVNGIGGAGIEAFGGDGVNAGGDGIVAGGGFMVQSVSRGRAGLFMGDVEVQGNFNVTGGGTKNFKIDHPLDPENKYLYHAAIESSEVLNIYSGNVTTDDNGEATVTLPDWFEAVNRDFRYQLTVIGTFAQAIIGDEIKGNRFKIKTNSAAVKVSWQVTGIRSDAAMRKHPFKVEEEKPQSERGSYLAPDAYDQPEERSTDWARHPQLMQQRKQQHLEAQPQSKLQ